LAFFERSAGIAIEIAPPPLLPKPPPVYSLTSTTSDASIPTQRATGSTVRATLCVEPYRYSLPFCQCAIALRVSIGWWLVDWTTKVSSTMTAASLNPSSRLPYDHASGACPMGSCPGGAAEKSSAVHFID
jgi:hypothetical protein